MSKEPETGDFYQAVERLIRLHMNCIKSYPTQKSFISSNAYRNEFKTLKISSARGIGHTYTAIRLLQALPGSILIVHSTQQAQELQRQYSQLTDFIYPFSVISNFDAFRSIRNVLLKKVELKSSVPLFIIDTARLLEARDAEKFNDTIKLVDTYFNVKLFLYLE